MAIGIGILGLAHGHVGTYCGQWKQWPDEARLVAAWDHDARRSAAGAEQRAPAVPAMPAELLSRPEVAAVVIGAKTCPHANLAPPLREFLQGRRPSIAGAAEGREVLCMTLACDPSARQGRRPEIRDVHD